MTNPRTDLRFTVLMPVHNRADIFLLFDKAVESVFNSTVIPIELVLIVDGPLGKSFEEKVIDLAVRYPIRVIWLPTNQGIIHALNVGLASINTKWIMRADADDTNLPNRFELQIRLLEEGYDLVGGAIEEVDSMGKLLAVKSLPAEEISIRKYIRYRNPFNHMTVAFSSEIAKQVGGYPQLALKEDYGLWGLFLGGGARVANLSEVLVRATTGRDMYKRRGGWQSIKSEVFLQQHLVRCGVQSRALGFIVALMRIVLLALPASILSTFYMRFLRGTLDKGRQSAP